MRKKSKDLSKKQKRRQSLSWLLINGLLHVIQISVHLMCFARMEKKRRVLSETQKSRDREKEQKNNIQSQALAFEEWKKRKDEQIKLQKSTKKAVEKVHKNPWRPARSVEYDYLKSPQPLPNEKSKNNNNTSISSSSLSSQSSTAPTLKSVKVCCQTLEYWCTCQK